MISYRTPKTMRLQGFPEGWYAIAFAKELNPGTVLRRRLMDQELVVYRGASGQVVAMDAYCPHLGAHLAEGGKVVGDNIQCPFHGFQFGPQGDCRSTPYGGRVPRACVRTHAVEEHFGVVLCFFAAPVSTATATASVSDSDSDFSGVPTWHIRPVSAEHSMLAWGSLATKQFLVRTHPQEIIENTVDTGHFTPVHDYADCTAAADVQTDGPHLLMRYRAVRNRGLLGAWDPNKLKLHMAITASGVGFSRVEVTDHTLGLQVRLLVMPTPIDDEHVEVRVAIQVARPQGKWWRVLLRMVPASLLTWALAKMAAAEMAKDFAPDCRIWEHKRYQPSPRLAQGDGPIMRFRAWAQQFYTTDSLDRSARLRVLKSR